MQSEDINLEVICDDSFYLSTELDPRYPDILSNTIMCVSVEGVSV